jgi:plastocyanin
MKPALALAGTLAILLSMGCAVGQTPGTKAAAQSAGSAAAQPGHVLMAKSYRFEPVEIRIPAGTTVTWVNEDNFTHNVQFSGALDWTSPSLKPGESTSRTFETPGEYAYVCVFHSHDMRGRVVVLPR